MYMYVMFLRESPSLMIQKSCIFGKTLPIIHLNPTTTTERQMILISTCDFKFIFWTCSIFSTVGHLWYHPSVECTYLPVIGWLERWLGTVSVRLKIASNLWRGFVYIPSQCIHVHPACWTHL